MGKLTTEQREKVYQQAQALTEFAYQSASEMTRGETYMLAVLQGLCANPALIHTSSDTAKDKEIAEMAHGIADEAMRWQL